MDPEAIAAIVVPIAIFSIPIVVILTNHQRKMAELIHARHNDKGDNKLQERVAQLEHEVTEMKDRMNTSAIENDRLRQLLSNDEHLNT